MPTSTGGDVTIVVKGILILLVMKASLKIYCCLRCIQDGNG